MSLGIDIREACRPERAGKGQWTTGFVMELIRHGIPLTLFTDTPLPLTFTAPHVRAVVITKRGLAWHLAVAWRVLWSKEIDLYVSPTSYIVPALLGRKRKYAIVVHDLIAFRGDQHDRKATWIERLTLKRAASRAHRVFAISTATKRDLLLRYASLPPSHVSVIHAGPMRTNPPAHRGDRRTILCVGTLCPRKNQERLIRAYHTLPADLRAKYDLLLAGGRGWHDEPILQIAKETPGVAWADYVSDEEYENLLTHCAIFALPSLYEGFGMQILDALQRGMPVLTSAEGSLAEVAGDAAYLVDPWSIASIARGLEQLLTNATLRDELQQKGPKQAALFTWKRTVDLFLTAIENP